MAEKTTKKTPEGAAGEQQSAIDKTAEMSQELLASVEAGQRAAIEAVRTFVAAVDEAFPAIGERPSRRETVIDAALELSDKLVTAQYDFLRSIAHDAGRALSRSGSDRA